jgi:sugar phosphate isomerase/epimerase
MSTSCVFPLAVDDAFRLARSTGFDGVEIMVTQDRSTQDATALLALSARYELPILSIHAPVLPLAQFVWGGGPRGKLEGAARLATEVGASTVVVHPPYIWEPSFARDFSRIVRDIAEEHRVTIAVENMFALAFGPLRLAVHSPSPDPTRIDCDAMTLDFSHAAVAGRDALEFAISMGARLRHIHLCDGTIGTDRLIDEHLVPGRGSQPVAEVLRYLATSNWDGALIAEVHAARGASEEHLVAMLRETVHFAREATTAEAPQPPAVATVIRP